MVFESVVADLLNRVLGDYVENLDSSQLKLGIWGGDVVLNKLVLKQSAVDDLNLPVKTVAGHLGNLVIKVNWKNIYYSPIHVNIKGLYLLAIPNLAVTYDPEMEEKALQEAKQRQLIRIELAKLQEATKNSENIEGDSFVEKLKARLIKNLHITIEDVHIRYEDSYTNPERPFACGITLKKLAMESTNSNWEPTLSPPESSQVFKLVSLECLSLYWLCDAHPLLSNLDAKGQLEHFRGGITSNRTRPFEDSYILGPLTSQAQLRINPRPELDSSQFSIPKLFLNLVVKKLAVGLSKQQYQDVFRLLQAFQRMEQAAPYRKFRSNLPSLRGNAKQWWHFAYTCILEEHVRRRRRDWRWEHIRDHRKTVRKYIELYKTKLRQSKLSLQQLSELENLEKKLNVFNITLARRQAEVQVERVQLEERKREESQAKQGWFSSWFGRGTSTTPSESDEQGLVGVVMKKLQAEFTTDEKSKLYDAIGYEENASPASYPKHFVENLFQFALDELDILLHDTEQHEVVILSSLSGVTATIEQRPAAQAFKASVTVTDFSVEGSPSLENSPRLVRAFDQTRDRGLLTVLFETNPLDESCDQRIRLAARPLVVTYHAESIRKVSNMFQAPEPADFSQLQATARQKLEDLKEMSSTGLQYAIEKHAVVDVDIDVQGSYVLVPFSGCLKPGCSMVLFNMGSLTVRSEHLRKKDSIPSVSKMVRSGSTDVEIWRDLTSKSYDKFRLELSNIQILSLMEKEEWLSILNGNETKCHILRPMRIELLLEKCLILDDPRLPKIKISGSLPSIFLDINDTRLVNLASVLQSISLAASEPQTVASAIEEMDVAAVVSNEDSDLRRIGSLAPPTAAQEPVVQAIDLAVDFNIADVNLLVSVTSAEKSEPLLEFSMKKLSLDLTCKTYETSALMSLQNVVFQHTGYRIPDCTEKLSLISSYNLDGEPTCLLVVKYLEVSPRSPEFRTKYNSVRKKLNVAVCSLTADLHLEALLSTLQFANELSGRIGGATEKLMAERASSTSTTAGERSAEALRKVSTQVRRRGQATAVMEDVDFKLEAQMEQLKIALKSVQSNLAEVSVVGMDVGVTIKPSQTVVHAGLAGFHVIDCSRDTLYPKIASVDEKEALVLDFTLFNNSKSEADLFNMDIVDIDVTCSTGRLKAVYLSRFFNDLLAFVDHFQTAKDRLIEASSAAAESIRQNVQEAYASSTRIRLDVKLKAPHIIVPQNSRSKDALLVDLGRLALKNRLSLAGARNELGYPAVLDLISISLQELQLKRIVVDDSRHEDDCRLLGPIAVDVSVQRNLSAWYTAVPEISISAKLQKIQLVLDQEKYGSSMKIVLDNLAEGSKDTAELQQPNRGTPGQTGTVTGTVKPILESSISTEGSEGKMLQKYGPVRTKLACSAELEEVGLELFADVKHQESLAKFAVRGFSASAQLMSDSSLEAKVALASCLLEDTRPKVSTPLSPVRKPGTKPIVRLFYPKESADTVHGMIAVTFRSTSDQQSFVDMRVSGFTLVLCPSYMLKLANFFTAGLPQQPAATSTEQPAINDSLNAGTEKTGPVVPNALTTVSLRLDRPDIILVEEMDLDAYGLIMNMEVDFNVKITPTFKNASGSISQLHIFSSVLDPERRKESSAEVLSPCTITVLANMEDVPQSCRVSVEISDVLLSVSPGTIELLANASKTLSLQEEAPAETNQATVSRKDLWETKTLEQLKLPFLEPEIAQEVSADKSPYSESKPPVEQLIFSVSQFAICLEGGRRNQTYPLVMLESSFTANVRNWSSAMEAEAVLKTEAAYYSSTHALWEPLLELVEDGSGGHRRWELAITVLKNPALDVQEYEVDQKPPLSIKIESTDNMEITVTRSFLDVAETLGESFGAAVKQQLSKKDLPTAPYMIRNDLDLNIELELDKSEFSVVNSSSSGIKSVVLEPGTEVGLKLSTSFRSRSILREQSKEEKLLHILIPEYNYRKALPVNRASKRYLPCVQRGESRGFIFEVRNDFGFRFVTLRSVVQIRNHFRLPVDVYYMTKSGNEVAGAGRLEGCKSLNVLPHALYTPTGELFFCPQGYAVSYQAYVWRDLQRFNSASSAMVMECPPRNDPKGDPFYFQVDSDFEHIFLEDTRKKTLHSFCYQIHLRPAVSFHNLLPVPVHVVVSGTVKDNIVQPGASLDLTAVKPGVSTVVLKILDYMDRDWSCKEEVKLSPPELSVWTFDSYEGTAKASLHLGMHSAVKDKSLHLSLYCPFWMINKTELMLTYKRWASSVSLMSVASLASFGGDEDILYHPENFRDPVMFSFHPKSFFGKKKVQVRVEDSSWSEPVSLDAAGNSGTLICVASDIKYQLGVFNELSNSSLTRLLTFTPYYVITNRAAFDIEAREGCPHLVPPVSPEWHLIPAGQSLPFWPKFDQKLVVFRLAGSSRESKAVSYDSQIAASTLLALDDDTGGLYVDFNVTESSVTIICDQYQDGNAPALLVNSTEKSVVEIVEVSAPGTSPCHPVALHPQQARYFTWEHPTGPRLLSWKHGEKEFQDGLKKDATGVFSQEDSALRWISFLHGRQRIVLFTDDIGLVGDILRKSNLDIFEQEISLSINGIGVSLTDTASRCEVLYAGIRSSGVVWQTSKNGRHYRAMRIRECSVIEDAFQRHLKLMASSTQVNPIYSVDGGLEVDFSEWKLHRPKERLLRRSYQAGLWLRLQFGQHSRLIHLCLNRLQIDNQLPDCVFPVVLAPVPPPKSVAAEAVPHPFIETSIVERFVEGSDVKQFQYVKLLIQELHVRVDMSLVNALGTVLAGNTSDLKSATDLKENLEKDMASVRQSLSEKASASFTRDPENYYGYLHLSPLKIHFSFSNTGRGGAVGSYGDNPLNNIFGLLMRTVGVSVTEIQDVVFRLAYFERVNTFASWNSLTQELQSHYVGQAIKQFYVLALGLDVIGNPFGLAVGISHGVEQLFYEPIQGAVQGPEEFFEGLSIGAKSLIGHTVGGFAGAASRITGTLGKGFAFLTFDEDYQTKRRENLLRRPANIKENLAQGSKGLLLGVIDGVSGIVLKPAEGAQQEGVEGFFKGLGKGVAGLVTRPAAGLLDFASGTFDAMRRAADIHEETMRMRPPRYVNPEGVLQPYDRHHAEGNNILRVLEKGKFANTDNYVEHVSSGDENKYVLLVTDQRIMRLYRQDLFVQWQIEWSYTYDEIADIPTAHNQGIFIPLRQTKKKVLGMFSSRETGKEVPINSKEKSAWILRKIEETMRAR